MALQEFWIGSVGPLLYYDTDTYPDAVTLRAFRGEQIYLENAPANDEEVVRLVDLNLALLDYIYMSYEDETLYFDDEVLCT